MKQRKTWLIISIVVTLISFYLLVTGSSLLTVLLINEPQLPLGTISTWLGFIGLSSSVYLGIENLRVPQNWMEKLLSEQLKVALTLSVLWILISYYLAGNLSFTFSESRTFQGGQTAMKIFWILNYAIVIIPILTLFSYFILRNLKSLNKQ